MSPLQLAIDKVGRAVASFHPRTLPLLLRAHYGRELGAWCLLPLMLGALEGGVVAVIAKTVFSASVHTRWLNLAVAILVGAPAFANVVSFLWAAASHGRPKIRFLVALQVAVAVCVALIAVAPAAPIGLFGFTAGVVVARMCWSGVVALRSTVWRANYPRRVRASLAGKLATVQALAMTLAAAGIGLAMTADPGAFRLLFPLAAVVGLAGAWVYSGLAGVALFDSCFAGSGVRLRLETSRGAQNFQQSILLPIVADDDIRPRLNQPLTLPRVYPVPIVFVARDSNRQATHLFHFFDFHESVAKPQQLRS